MSSMEKKRSEPLSKYETPERFLSSPVYEGEMLLEVDDDVVAIPTRIIIGPNISIEAVDPDRINRIFPDKGNAFSGMAYDLLEAMVGYDHSPDWASVRDFILSKYRELNKLGVDYPITIIYAHGEAKRGFSIPYITKGSKAEHALQMHEGVIPTNEVLYRLADKYYPNLTVEERPLVILPSCNISQNRKHKAEISHPRFAILYSEGLFHPNGAFSNAKLTDGGGVIFERVIPTR